MPVNLAQYCPEVRIGGVPNLEMVKQFIQICLNLFFTTILLISLCLVLIEGKCVDTHYKVLCSAFPIVEYFSDCTCMALQSPCQCLMEMLKII